MAQRRLYVARVVSPARVPNLDYVSLTNIKLIGFGTNRTSPDLAVTYTLDMSCMIVPDRFLGYLATL